MWSYFPFAPGSDDGRRIICALNDWLNSINPNLGRKKLPDLQEMWKSGDLQEKLVAVNAKICGVRTRYQVRAALGFRRHIVLITIHDQGRLHVCTLASTNVVLSAQTETTAMLQQVVTMLQSAPVRQCTRGLSIHSQVEPVGFNSQTTRVGHHPHF